MKPKTANRKQSKISGPPLQLGIGGLVERLRICGDSLENIAAILTTRGVVDQKQLAAIAHGLRLRELTDAVKRTGGMVRFTEKLIAAIDRLRLGDALDRLLPSLDLLEPLPPPPPPTFKGSSCDAQIRIDLLGPELPTRGTDH